MDIIFVLKIIFQSISAFFIGTILFDCLHYLFHKCMRSNNKILRRLGQLHSVHHQFYSADLVINESVIKKNLLQHVALEYVVQLLGISLCIFFFKPIAIMFAALLSTIIFIIVFSLRGIDIHHKPIKQLSYPRGGIFVDAQYHALHHIYPNKFFSSCIKILDMILGTSIQLSGKKIALTGASGALGQQMKKILEKEGATVVCFKYGVDYTYDNYDQLKQALSESDILVLCHGSKFDYAQQANCDSFIQMIELFKSVRKRDKIPLEIWGVGSEIECHPCLGLKRLKVYAASKRNFARQARSYYHDKDIHYRHLVHSGFISRMGPGLMTASFAAKMTLFLIKRGFKYVPVTYTGFAYLNYFRFLVHRK